jgi:hypothetical protein
VIERLRRAEELIKHQYLFVYRVNANPPCVGLANLLAMDFEAANRLSIVNVPFSRDKLDGEPVFAIPNSS